MLTATGRKASEASSKLLMHADFIDVKNILCLVNLPRFIPDGLITPHIKIITVPEAQCSFVLVFPLQKGISLKLNFCLFDFCNFIWIAPFFFINYVAFLLVQDHDAVA